MAHRDSFRSPLGFGGGGRGVSSESKGCVPTSGRTRDIGPARSASQPDLAERNPVRTRTHIRSRPRTGAPNRSRRLAFLAAAAPRLHHCRPTLASTRVQRERVGDGCEVAGTASPSRGTCTRSRPPLCTCCRDCPHRIWSAALGMLHTPLRCVSVRRRRSCLHSCALPASPNDQLGLDHGARVEMRRSAKGGWGPK